MISFWKIERFFNLSPIHINTLCDKLDWNCLCGWWESFFCNFFPGIFAVLLLSLPMEKSVFIYLNPLYPRMLCAKFGWNWHSSPGEEVENMKSEEMDKQSEKLTWSFSSGELKKLYSKNEKRIFFLQSFL